MRSRLPAVARSAATADAARAVTGPLTRGALRWSTRPTDRPWAQDRKRRRDPTMRARHRAPPSGTEQCGRRGSTGASPSTSVLDGALRRSVPAKAVPMLAPAPPLPTRAPWRDRPRVRLAGSGHADEPTDAAKPPSVISKPHAKRHRYERAWVCSATANHGVQIKSFCIDQDGHDSHGMARRFTLGNLPWPGELRAVPPLRAVGGSLRRPWQAAREGLICFAIWRPGRCQVADAVIVRFGRQAPADRLGGHRRLGAGLCPAVRTHLPATADTTTGTPAGPAAAGTQLPRANVVVVGQSRSPGSLARSSP